MTHSVIWPASHAAIAKIISALSKCSFEPVRCRLLSPGADMKRREFLGVVGGAAVTWPLTAHAEGTAMPVVGFVNSETPELFVDRLRGFRQGLKEAGYVESENVVIEYRWAESHADRLPALARDLV